MQFSSEPHWTSRSTSFWRLLFLNMAYFHTCPSVYNHKARLLSFVCATDACLRSWLNQTRSGQCQAWYKFRNKKSSFSCCVPTYCMYVAEHGLFSVLWHSCSYGRRGCCSCDALWGKTVGLKDPDQPPEEGKSREERTATLSHFLLLFSN